MKKILLGIALILALAVATQPKAHAFYIQTCHWSGMVPPYLPTGSVGSQGIQVGAYCSYFNTDTGTYSGDIWETWWIPWTTWFFPDGQTPACESENWASCNAYVDKPKAQLSTPSNPSK
jgi:hypothetical protein